MAELPDLISLPLQQVEGAAPYLLPRVSNIASCVVTVTHRTEAGDPTQVDSRFSAFLDSAEQAYSRRIKVTENWQPLDTAWVKDCSFLIVRAHVPTYGTTPAKEQTAEDLKKIVELAYGDTTPWLIRPGRIFVAEPSDIQGLKIRSQHGISEITVTAIPR